MIDPGTVVWMPGTGWDENLVCQSAFGWNYYACGETFDGTYTEIWCCPY